MVSDPAVRLQPGDRVGRYVIGRVVGQGATGVVYAGFDPDLDRAVAIKLLHPRAGSSSRLLREAQAVARLAHRNVVTIHDVGVVDRQPFLAMELIEGETLERWLARAHPWREVLAVLRDAGLGLAAAHGAGIVHGDFKPDNVLITPSGRVVVTDFGLARRDGDLAGDTGGDDVRSPSFPMPLEATQEGGFEGTPAYAAPELHEGARSDAAHRVLVTVKHFPGHGDTAVDTHLGLAKLEVSRQRLHELELVPFRAAIEAGVDSVMTAHLWVPSLESQEIPATVSPAILTDLLRKELGFKGLITTDAMDMQGLTSKFPAGEPAVRAIEAGADVLLMPANPEKAVNAIAAAVRSGRLTQKRIDESVEKLLRAKFHLGLHKQKLVDLESVNDGFDLEDDIELARTVAEKAVTLVRNEGSQVPAKAGPATCWFTLTESRYGTQGRRMSQELRQRSTEMRVFSIDPLWTAAEIEEAAKTASSCESNVVAAFVGYSGNGTLPEFQQNFLRTLLETRPVILVTLGNPYLVRTYPQVKAFLATFSTSQPSEAAAVRAVLGEIPISGRLPVSIPGIAKQGGGLGLTVGGGVR